MKTATAVTQLKREVTTATQILIHELRAWDFSLAQTSACQANLILKIISESKNSRDGLSMVIS